MAKHSRSANSRGGKQPVKPHVIRTPVQPIRPPQPRPMRQPNISRRPPRQPGR